jgi:flagellar biosynthesis protein
MKEQDKIAAVALHYNINKDLAPRVVAKGQGSIAEQILLVAKQHNIEIHKDAELVKILSILEIDSIIPLEAYAVVAEILSYIYRTNADLKNKS